MGDQPLPERTGDGKRGLLRADLFPPAEDRAHDDGTQEETKGRQHLGEMLLADQHPSHDRAEQGHLADGGERPQCAEYDGRGQFTSARRYRWLTRVAHRPTWSSPSAATGPARHTSQCAIMRL